MKIDGKTISGEILARLKNGRLPQKFLAGILVGVNSASKSFLTQKKKTAEEIGVDFRIYEFPESMSTDVLRKEILKIANHRSCGGVIVQLPLPGQINAQYILNVIPPNKDVDVLGERALGSFYVGRGKASPPSVGTVEEILRKVPIDLSSASVAVVGPGQLIGKPISVWLSGKVKELIVLDKGSDFGLLNSADLVISGVGTAGLIKKDMLKKDGGVIDFGYGKNEQGKISGDLDLDSVEEYLYFYTPTPGGTGPILVSKLLENFYKLNTK